MSPLHAAASSHQLYLASNSCNIALAIKSFNFENKFFKKYYLIWNLKFIWNELFLKDFIRKWALSKYPEICPIYCELKWTRILNHFCAYRRNISRESGSAAIEITLIIKCFQSPLREIENFPRYSTFAHLKCNAQPKWWSKASPIESIWVRLR